MTTQRSNKLSYASLHQLSSTKMKNFTCPRKNDREKRPNCFKLVCINPPYRLACPNCPKQFLLMFLSRVSCDIISKFPLANIGCNVILHSKKGVHHDPDKPDYFPVYALQSNMAWKCPLCLLFTCLTLDLLLSHFNSQHSCDTLNIKCRFDGCDRDYTKINSLTKHVWNWHRAHLYDSGQCNGTGILVE